MTMIWIWLATIVLASWVIAKERKRLERESQDLAILSYTVGYDDAVAGRPREIDLWGKDGRA